MFLCFRFSLPFTSLLLAIFLGTVQAEEGPSPGKDIQDAARKAEAERVARIRMIEVEWVTQNRDARVYLERDDRDHGRLFTVLEETPEQAQRNREKNERPLIWDGDYALSEQTVHVAMQGDKVRSETEGMKPQGTKCLLPMHRVTTADGTVEMTADLSCALVRWPMVFLNADHTPHLASIHNLGAFEWLRGGESRRRPNLPRAEEETLESVSPPPEFADRGLVAVRSRRGGNEALRVYDPAKDYSLVLRLLSQTQRHFPDAGQAAPPAGAKVPPGKLTSVVRREEFTLAFHEPAGVWLPTAWTFTHYGRPGEVLWSRSSKVLRCTVNEEIPPERLQLTPPPGSILSDQRTEPMNGEKFRRPLNTLIRLDGTRRIISPEHQGLPYDKLLN